MKRVCESLDGTLGEGREGGRVEPLFNSLGVGGRLVVIMGCTYPLCLLYIFFGTHLYFISDIF